MGGGMGGGMGQGGQQNDLFNSIPNVSPEMLNMGFSAGQDMINKQKEKWMPGMSSFWVDLKVYFAVSREHTSLEYCSNYLLIWMS